MSDRRDDLDHYARSTEPKDGAVERLRARHLWAGEALRAGARAPREGAVARLVARMHRGGARRRLRRAPLVLAIGTLAALAAVWLLRPPPAPDARLDERLDAQLRIERPLTEAVRVAYVGNGAARGTADATHVTWELGTLEVEVEPGRGHALAVETPEGLVEVVGTGFTVTRGPLGTDIAVRHGRVRVTCVGDAGRLLGPGETATCLPTRAAGMLGRARALRREGAASAEVLAAVDRGLALSSAGPAVGELTAVRLDVLLTDGRYDEALAAAEAYLRSGDPTRRADVLAIAERLRARR